MTLHRLTAQVPQELASALAAFEREFSYPLGPSNRFRISHGEAYLPFFQAMGEPEIAVIEEGGKILGGLARVERQLELHGPAGVVARTAHYLCDLKLRASARGSMVLPRLIRETKRAIEGSASVCCYCIVMEGTGTLPTDYTGRLGVPTFGKLADILILRIEALGQATRTAVVSADEIAVIKERIGMQGFIAKRRDPHLRSQMEPLPLATANGSACGILEDTRRGKQLFLDAGPELVSAHLSCFAHASPRAAGELIRIALAHTHAMGIPALFVALPLHEAPPLLKELEGLKFTTAPAAVYGHALEPGHNWHIDTAEI